ncbi:MAG: hypothetical protein ACM3OC_02120 [Deltaproteobacteria bacterium]
MKGLLAFLLISITPALPHTLSIDYHSHLNGHHARHQVMQKAGTGTPRFESATDEMWSYLRKGLTYLESPTPLLPPEAVAPSYIHPDGRGFGAYGFSPEAYEDVQRLYPYFRAFSWEQVLRSQKLYDLANRALCDWMLKSLSDLIPANAEKKEVFTVLHKAWNLGMGGLRKGREVVPSRARRAAEFLATS